MVPKIRKGQAPPPLSRDEFRTRYMERFVDPAFDAERDAIARVEAIAYDNFAQHNKAPHTEKAGPEFADPTYDLSVDFITTRARLKQAQKRYQDRTATGRVLVISGSDRNDGTCPGEIAKTFRLATMACDVLRDHAHMDVDLLDLSVMTSEFGKQIHPCKGCLSTAMPLCHWPCTCYPNHALGQVHDWMAEIYERWTLAHGVLIVTPVYWYSTPSALKLMIDRLVCADGGNPDPTTTQGKKAALAKKMEMDGWDYPQHLKGRAYGVVVHGDTAGAEGVRRGLTDWLDGMGLVSAGYQSSIDRYIDYYGHYATSHDALDEDTHLHEEVRNVARAVANAVTGIRNSTFVMPDAQLKEPRPK